MNRTVFPLSLSLVALMTATSAMATPISMPVVTGLHAVFGVVAPGALAPVPSSPATIAAALAGTAADPGGNIELGKFGSSPVTTLAGVVGGKTITLSSLTLADWTNNSNELATRYIQDAATAAFGAPFSATDLNTALFAFFNIDLNPDAGTLNPYQLVSDPNISYVNLDDGTVRIGLAGLLDATALLQGLNPIAPAGSQASEVVKVTYKGETSYLYTFFATPSGYSIPGTPIFTGNYEVTIPEPASLALFGLGAALLGFSRSRRQR